MTCVPSRSGRIGVELLLLAELLDARLEVVHAPGQLGRLALVAGGAVAGGQVDEPVVLVAGVADEATHRRSRSSPSP